MPNKNCHEIEALEQGTEAWLEQRRKVITATDIAPIMGVSPWATNYTLWCDKLNGAEKKESKYLEWGSRLEPIIIDKVVEALGIKNDRRGKCYIDGWKMASLDGEGELDGEKIIIEAKTSSHRDGWFDDDGNETIPLHYKLQAQWQMIVTGCKRVIFTVLCCGSDWWYRECKFDEGTAQDISILCEQFYNCMVTKTEPSPVVSIYSQACEAESQKRSEALAKLEASKVLVDGNIYDRWLDAQLDFDKAKLAKLQADNLLKAKLSELNGTIACIGDEANAIPVVKLTKSGKGFYLKKI